MRSWPNDIESFCFDKGRGLEERSHRLTSRGKEQGAPEIGIKEDWGQFSNLTVLVHLLSGV